MYCHFGQKWTRLHSGPGWAVARSAQEQHSEQFDAHKKYTMEVHMTQSGCNISVHNCDLNDSVWMHYYKCTKL